MNEQPLSDAELAAALQNLSFEDAAHLIEQQERARANYAANQKVQAEQAAQQAAQRAAEEESLRAQQQAQEIAERAKQAELERQAEVERQAALAREAEQARQADIAREAEAAKQVELAREAEAAKQAEIELQAQQQRDAELARQAEAEAAENQRIADMARIAEANRLASAAFAEAAVIEQTPVAQLQPEAAETAEATPIEAVQVENAQVEAPLDTAVASAVDSPINAQVQAEAQAKANFHDILGDYAPKIDAEVTNPVISVGSKTASDISLEEQITADQELKADAEHFVDDLILSVGGENDDEAAEPAFTSKKEEGTSIVGLIASWNGSGALFTLIGAGFGFAANQGSFGSLLAGGFVALVIIGLAASLAAIAARRGKLPQQVLSRATFGVTGNLIPALVLTVAKLIALATMFLILSQSILVMFPNFNIPAKTEFALMGFPISLPVVPFIAYGLAVLAFALSFLRGKALAVVRLLTTTLTIALIALLVVLGETSQAGSYRSSLTYQTDHALGLASSLVIIFALLWGTTAADENNRIRSDIAGVKIVVSGILNWVIFGSLALIAGFIAQQLTWSNSGSALIAAIAAVLFVFALATAVAQTTSASTGIRVKNPGAGVALIMVILASVAAGLLFDRIGTDGLWLNFVGYLPIVGVPVVAWLGIFCSDVVLRKVNYHAVSLERNYGFYRSFNLVNIAGWLVISAVGLGLITSRLPEFAFTGYLASIIGLSDVAITSNVGVWVALVLGFIWPIATGIPRIRRQEAEVIALEARRGELRDISISGDFA